MTLSTALLITLTVLVGALITIAAVAGLFLLQTFLHEGCHYLAAKALGYEVDGFTPWPHEHEGKRKFGNTSVVGDITHPGFYTAPMWFALVQAAMCATLGVKLWPVSGWDAVAWAFSLSGAVDLVNWWVGYLREAEDKQWLDGRKWRALR